MTWQNTLSNLLTRSSVGAHNRNCQVVAIPPHDYVKRRKLGGARVNRLTFDARSISDPWRDPSVSSRWHNHVSRLIIGPHPRSCREREREESSLSFRVFVAIKGDGQPFRVNVENVARASESAIALMVFDWAEVTSRPAALILAASSWRALCGLTCVYFHRLYSARRIVEPRFWSRPIASNLATRCATQLGSKVFCNACHAVLVGTRMIIISGEVVQPCFSRFDSDSSIKIFRYRWNLDIRHFLLWCNVIETWVFRFEQVSLTFEHERRWIYFSEELIVGNGREM